MPRRDAWDLSTRQHHLHPRDVIAERDSPSRHNAHEWRGFPPACPTPIRHRGPGIRWSTQGSLPNRFDTAC